MTSDVLDVELCCLWKDVSYMLFYTLYS